MNEIDFWAVDKKNKPVKAKIYNMLYSLSFSFDIHTKDESTYTCYLTREYYYLNCDLKSRPVIIIDNIYGEVFVVKCIQSPERDAVNKRIIYSQTNNMEVSTLISRAISEISMYFPMTFDFEEKEY